MTHAAGADLLMAVEPEDVTAGTAGFLVIAALVVGTVFLLRSLNKQLKKVDFEETDDDGDGPNDTGNAGGSTDDAGDAGGDSNDDADAGSPGPASPVSDEPEEGPRSPRA